MATLAALLNHPPTAGQALTRNMATPAASTTSATSSTSSPDDSSSGSATISANDFLTLLVTEMQNQDPTADTDPNEYINQLVNVNSLEQLIDINQTLSTDLGSTSTDGTATQATPGVASSTNPATPAASPVIAAHHSASPLPTTPRASASAASAAQTNPSRTISGNLSSPNASPAAQRVGHALAGRTHAAVEGIPLANQ
jgi:flagellar basal-body rod modification protein FlgD